MLKCSLCNMQVKKLVLSEIKVGEFDFSVSTCPRCPEFTAIKVVVDEVKKALDSEDEICLSNLAVLLMTPMAQGAIRHIQHQQPDSAFVKQLQGLVAELESARDSERVDGESSASSSGAQIKMVGWARAGMARFPRKTDNHYQGQ